MLRTCGEKLWQYGPLKKWPLARYVHEHMQGFFKLAIFDEIHKTKAKGSNIGYAFKMMINSVDYVLGGTGTLFGGKSTDLFFLLHRINHEVRKRFGFNQESAWSATYGRQQMIFADEGDEESFTTGKRRRIARVKELPGISPAIYRWVFEQVVFLKVSELGFQMPPYAEEIERLVMEEVQKEQYEWLYNTLYERIREGASSFSRQGMKEAMSLMSVFLQNCLSRPMSGFRTERVFWKDPSAGKQVPYRVRRGTSEHYGYTDTDDARAIFNLTDTDVDDENPANPADQRGLFPDMLAVRKAEQEVRGRAHRGAAHAHGAHGPLPGHPLRRAAAQGALAHLQDEGHRRGRRHRPAVCAPNQEAQHPAPAAGDPDQGGLPRRHPARRRCPAARGLDPAQRDRRHRCSSPTPRR